VSPPTAEPAALEPGSAGSSPAAETGAAAVAAVATSTRGGETLRAQPARSPQSPLQAELESFGISPKRAAALAGDYPEAHVASRIAYVRALVEGASRGRNQALRNPAGYLARAIEDGYTSSGPAAGSKVPGAGPAGAAGAHAAGVQAASGRPASAAAPAQPDHPAPEHSTAPANDANGGSTGVVPAGPAEPELTGAWGQLAAALRAQLSGATYAAWVQPAQAGDEPVEEPAGGRQRLTVLLPTPFALERWRRPPIAEALAGAAAALGIDVEVKLVAATGVGAGEA
jgi:hypothetical protein